MVKHMIPLKLYLKNFLSYGSPGQTINFEPHHLICLSGKNGHGKSALLDALTWVLWGQARKIAHAGHTGENLIKLGQSDMVVMLDFMCNNIVYRVRREVAQLRGKLTSQLDVGIVDETTQQLHAITEKTIRDTQELINRIIGLNGEAFQSSAFFRQGNSDEFSKKSPKDRKDILANLIGLDQIEQLRRRIIEKGREIAVHRQHKEQLCEHIAGEVQHHTQLSEELLKLSFRAEETTKHEEDLAQQLAQITEQQRIIAGEYHTLQSKQADIGRISHMINTHYDMLRPALHKWRSLRRLQHAYHRLSSFEKRRSELMHARTAAQQFLANEASLTTQLQSLKTQMLERTTNIRADYEVQITRHKEKLYIATTQLHTKIHAHDMLHKTLESNQQELVTLDTTIATTADQLAAAQAHLQSSSPLSGEKSMQRHARFQAHFMRLTREEATLASHQYNANDVQHTACLWCLRPLSPADTNVIQRNITLRLSRIKKQMARVTSCIEHLTGLIAHQKQLHATMLHCQQHVQACTAQLQALTTARNKTQNLTQQYVTQLTQLQEEIQHLRLQQQEHEADITRITHEQKHLISHDGQLVQLMEKVAAHEQHLASLARPPKSLDQVQQELDQLAAEEIHYAALTSLPEIVAHIKVLCTTIRTVKQQRKILEQELHAYAAVEERFKSHEKMRGELLEQSKKVRHEREEIIHRKGSLEQACLHIEKQKEQLNHERQELAKLVAELDDHAILAQALSKDGIQGILIEHVLPDIEREANYLLSKLTDNQTQLYFESVRELKNGSLKETLDIKISDAHGIRPYELFSGGEAFRIDFALRLAISKFLARRSGSSIQTLIIDEGFGSQDEEGLSRIMEALYAIQNEFAKIIIVSHLPSMKDQFPVHFHVQKGTKGSFVQIIQQG
jgi:exonuclease SbcC